MEKLKTIALYLPQYHRVKENDKWWGEGYTEWTAVKQAEQYYQEHYQPRVPLNQNYYDLNNKETMKWQTKLAEQYGVFGFCFFHYYFKDGRKILEKPAENLLSWTDIPMNFCFSWANASWTRTWSKIAGGSMASKFEQYNKDEDDVLLKQEYGDEKDWKDHFEYLLPFFRDERYIKIEGKPVFIFHIPEDIECLGEMTKYWRELAKASSFPDIYLIGVITDIYKEFPMLDALYAHEPRFIMRDYIRYMDASKKDVCSRYNLYNEACEWSVLREYNQKQKIYFGTYVGFDTTPRHAKKGTIIDKSTPEAFENSYRRICQRSILCNNEFVFINAWNEWGEGNYLEPDERHKYGYLEAVQKVNGEKFESSELFVNEQKKNRVFYQVIEEREREAYKFKCYQMCFDKWMTVLEHGRDIDYYFRKHDIRKIAIYGFSGLGKHVYEHLIDKLEIVCFIDQRTYISNYKVPVYGLENELPDFDAVVVTPLNEYQEIKKVLNEKGFSEVFSVSEILEECI